MGWTNSNTCLQTNHPFYGHHTGQPALADSSSWELEDFVGAKFYCVHALADGNQHIRIREKTLEFSSTVLSALSRYLAIKHTHPFNGPLSGTTRVSRYQRGKNQSGFYWSKTVSGSGIIWATCKSAPRSRQIAMPAPHRSVFYRPDALPAAQRTASKHCILPSKW